MTWTNLTKQLRMNSKNAHRLMRQTTNNNNNNCSVKSVVVKKLPSIKIHPDMY